MSERRTTRLSRPRTRVYDCNYNIGERYYKPVVDSLDRKYGGGGLADRLIASEEPISRRSPFESTSRPSRASANDFEDDIETDIVSSMQRLKSSRAARQELEDELDALASERSIKKRGAALAAARESILEDELDTAVFGNRKKKNYFQDQLLDTVGVNSKLQKSMAEESISSFKKKAQTAIDEFEDETSRRGLSVLSRREDPEEGTLRRGLKSTKVCVRVPRMAKWTALKAGSLTESLEESFDEKAAKARAKQSRARLLDLDAEMDALVERGAARDKRLQGLKALLADSSASADDLSSLQVKQRITKTEKKVTF